MNLASRLEEIYARHPHHIAPFVGAAFTEPQPRDLRVMAVGINAYIGADAWQPAKGTPAPDWFRGWFRGLTHRFHKGVKRDADALTAALTVSGAHCDGLQARGLESFFVTNAIKVYLPAAVGKHAHQLTDAHFEQHLEQWHDELDALAEAGVLPHIVAIFGAPFWRWACAAFRAPQTARYRHLRVHAYEPAGGACLHYANLLRVEGAAGPQKVLLVRMRHPSSRQSTATPKWLLKRPEFRALVGLHGTPLG